MKAELKFDLPDENNDFEKSIYGANLHAALKNIRAKVIHNLDKSDLPDQRRQIYAEINNIIVQEIVAEGVAQLF